MIYGFWLVVKGFNLVIYQNYIQGYTIPEKVIDLLYKIVPVVDQGYGSV